MARIIAYAQGTLQIIQIRFKLIAAGDHSISIFVNFTNILDELTSFNANKGHFEKQPPFRSEKRNSHEVW